MASYEPGYEDERFQHPVGQSFHCGICYNVVKDPAMCRHNEHLFCRACITRRLMDSQTCPSCLEPLTVDTLTQPSRTVMNLLSELKIRCQFFYRGCEEFIELGNVDRHVKDCGFAPAMCSNEGCRLEVNKQDLLHHETAVCELRRVQRDSCDDIRQEINIVQVNLAIMNEKLSDVSARLDRNEQTSDRKEKTLKRTLKNVKTVVENVNTKIQLLQEQLNKQEESNRRLKADNVEMKKCLTKITEQLETITTRQTLYEVQTEQMKKEIGKNREIEKGLKSFISKGKNCRMLKAYECLLRI